MKIESHYDQEATRFMSRSALSVLRVDGMTTTRGVGGER